MKEKTNKTWQLHLRFALMGIVKHMNKQRGRRI